MFINKEKLERYRISRTLHDHKQLNKHLHDKQQQNIRNVCKNPVRCAMNKQHYQDHHHHHDEEREQNFIYIFIFFSERAID